MFSKASKVAATVAIAAATVLSLSACSAGHSQAFSEVCNDRETQDYITNASSNLTLENVAADKEIYKSTFQVFDLDSYEWAGGLVTAGNDVFGPKISKLADNEKDLKEALLKFKADAIDISDKLVPYLQDTSDNFSTDWFIAASSLQPDAFAIAAACVAN